MTIEVSATPPAPSAPARHGADIFGHPRALTFLFATEMWERFSYYGMRALLVLYMVKYLFQPERAGTVIGLASLKSALEFAFGPLDAQPLASHIYGLYTGLVYLTPVFGGLLADRVLGQRRTIVIGALLMAAGHFMIAFEPLLLFALTLLILGNGAFKPNMSSQVGGLYAPGDPRRDRAYSIFYVGINLGAFFAPLVCGTLGEEAGWHYGFGAAGIGMLIGLAIYLAGSSALSPEARDNPVVAPADAGKPSERSAIVALLVLCLPVTFFWATYEQQGNTVALWTADHTDRAISLFGWRTEIPVTWFQAFNPFLIFALTPLIVAFWGAQARKGREPSTLVKMAFGCFGVAAANLILMTAAMVAGGAPSSWLWLLGYFVVITVGELYLSPIGLSLVSKVAPARRVSMMMGIWLSTSFTGNFAAGWLGSYWSAMAKQDFFLMIAGVAAAAGIVIWLFDRPLRKTLG